MCEPCGILESSIFKGENWKIISLLFQSYSVVPAMLNVLLETEQICQRTCFEWLRVGKLH